MIDGFIRMCKCCQSVEKRRNNCQKYLGRIALRRRPKSRVPGELEGALEAAFRTPFQFAADGLMVFPEGAVRMLRAVVDQHHGSLEIAEQNSIWFFGEFGEQSVVKLQRLV